VAEPLPRRAVVALGGNAITPSGSSGSAEQQTAAIAAAMAVVARVVAEGCEVVITHGNGPQVGNLLTKNVLARHVVPAMPLHWCVAQTQATIGFAMVVALEHELAARGIDRPVVPVLSRVLVAADDPAAREPVKPIGRFVPEAEARAAMADEPDQIWREVGPAGWRRVVPSPEPLECLDGRAVHALLDAGAVVIANGGGGVPVCRRPDGRLEGVEAVVDKDLSAALLALELGADHLAILTDVDGVAVGFGRPDERWLAAVAAPELRELQAAGTFGTGSMAPKVEAALRFVEGSGHAATIAALDRADDALRGRSGTRVLAQLQATPAARARSGGTVRR
jgi:carbamate kinase